MARNNYNDDSYFYGQLRSIYKPYDFQKKSRNIARYCIQMLNRTTTMFEYENLPDTIPKRILERYLQINGRTLFFKYNDKYYVSFGTYGGEPDEYYEPTLYIVSNPYLKLFNTFDLKTDECVLIRNDSSMVGFTDMFRAYATQMAENDISMRLTDINSRMMSLITAPDDESKRAADEFIKKIVDGEMSAIQTNKVLKGMETIETQPYASGQALSVSLTSLIELQQYLKAGWNNDVGLNANYNMKRESLNSAESQLNEDVLLPTPADMLEQRRLALDKINEMFGLDIKVDLSSAWKKHESTAEAIVEDLNGDGEQVDSVEDGLSSEPEEVIDNGGTDEEPVSDETTAEEPEDNESVESEEPEAESEEPAEEPDEITEQLEEISEQIEELQETVDELVEEKEDEDNAREDNT